MKIIIVVIIIISLSCLSVERTQFKMKKTLEANSSWNSLFRYMITLMYPVPKLIKDQRVALFFLPSPSFLSSLSSFLSLHSSSFSPSSLHPSLPPFLPPFIPSFLFPFSPLFSFPFLLFPLLLPLLLQWLGKNRDEFLRAILQQWKYSGSHMPSLEYLTMESSTASIFAGCAECTNSHLSLQKYLSVFRRVRETLRE